jgi:hypothetical protein
VAPKKYISVKDLNLRTCGSGHEGLELQNIKVFNDEEEIVISGTANVKIFLSAPVTVRIPHYFSEIHQSSSVCSEYSC